MFDRFTDRARKVMSLARQEALRLRSEYIGTEHILLGLLLEGTGVAARVLKNMQVDLRKVRQEIEKRVGAAGASAAAAAAGGSTAPPAHQGQLPFTPKARKVLDWAQEEAGSLGVDYLGTEHLLLGLLRETDGVAAEVLRGLEVKLEDVREEALEILGADMPQTTHEEKAAPGKAAKPKAQALEAFGRDLTELAKQGKLDPVIGRVREIERIMQILSRRTKNNPVLLGEAGVGKTAIVEGLAQRICCGSVPEPLRNRRIIILDLALMVAGTKYRGQFEERIKAVMAEVKRAKDIILFIDELHTLVGAGAAEGAIDASNVLKPALSRGEIQCIGSTTPTEYRKYIEKDTALERRFQAVMVDPNTKEEALQVLKGIREKYEDYHHVRYTDESLDACVELSSRFITGRFLPDKAIDVMDEAGARVRLQSMSSPPDTKDLDAQLRKLEQEKEESVGMQDFERAALLRDKKLQLERKKEAMLREWKDKHKEATGMVDADMTSETVSRMTGIPVSKLESKEVERLLKAEDDLHRTVVSQDEAIAAVARAIRRSRSGMKDPRRPIGSFIFVGPTGCGKTLLARELARVVFGQHDALVQIDMSEYMEKHNASRLVGAPPGYVGYEEGGQLTERIRRRPYAVVLLDEIEKAHFDVHNMLLQIMEEGRLTDSFGRNVDFKNVILIMTSNIGADVIKNQSLLGFRKPTADGSYESMKKLLTKEIEQVFRPEFLNRLDDIIVFRALTRVDMEKVVQIEMKAVIERMQQRNVGLTLTKEAAQHLIDISYNPEFGARPLRRAIERHVEDIIADMILRGKVKPNGHITLRVKDDQLFFDTEPAKECAESVVRTESIT